MENNLFDIILSPEYWISEFEVINIDKLNLLIRVYKSIIDKGDRDLKYRERHHMVPKSFSEELSSNKQNILICTPREHYIIHHIMSKIFGGIYRKKMLFAFLRMCNSNNPDAYISNSHTYEKLRSELSDTLSETMTGKNNPMYGKERNVSIETRRKLSDAGRGRKHNTTTRAKISKALRGKKKKPFSDEWKSNIAKSMTGELNHQYGKQSPMYGRSLTDEQRRKISESKIGNNYTKGKIWITNGMTSLLIDPCDAEEYYSEGFWRGRSRNKMRVPVTLYCDSNLRDVLRYAHVHDAGADVILQKDICIKPGTNRIPLGFNLKLPPGTMGLLFPRSSIMGLGIQFNCAPIDAEYTGEYNLICYNCTNEEINFSKGTKIVQLVIMPCIHIDNIETGGSHRGSNGIGSTGK